MIAFDPRLVTSFTAGLLASINPCGFVLLPTYLLYFLGMESSRPGTERGSIRRAFAVSLAVSAGFMTVFVVIGTITKVATGWFLDKSPWISVAIGIGLAVLGVAMMFGYRVPFTTPRLDVGRRDRSVASMFVFGITYAVVSIGCTLGPFLAIVLGGVTVDGFTKGIAAIGLYGIGMALVVTSLTVTLALANTAMLRIVRKGMSIFEDLAGVFVLLTGLYISWYWYSSITENFDGRLITSAGNIQQKLAAFVQNHQKSIVLIAAAVIAVAAIGSQVQKHRRRHEPKVSFDDGYSNMRSARWMRASRRSPKDHWRG